MKTKKTMKRWLAFLMMVAMVLTSQPFTVMADTVVGIVDRTQGQDENNVPSEDIQDSTENPGSPANPGDGSEQSSPEDSEGQADDVRKNIVTFEIAEGAKVTVDGKEILDGETALAQDGTLLYIVEVAEGYAVSEILVDGTIEGRLSERTDEEGKPIENEYIIENIQTDETVVSITTQALKTESGGTMEAVKESEEIAPAETESESVTESGTESEAIAPAETETESMTEAVAESEETAPAETETESMTEAVTESEETAPAETETESMTEAGTESEEISPTETESESEPATEAESDNQAEEESESEGLTPAETEPETVAAETESEAEPKTMAAETESETESEMMAAETEMESEVLTPAETEMETEVETEAESDQIIEDVPGISEATVFEVAADDGRIVKLSAPEGAFTVPASEVTMTADPLTAEQEAALVEQLTAMAEADGMMLTDYVAYDINLWVNDEIVQPLVPVQVTFENVDMTTSETLDGTVAEAPADMSEVEAVGFQMDTDTMELSDVNETTVSDDATPEDATVGVEVEHFTVTGFGAKVVDETNPVNYEFTLEQVESEEDINGEETAGEGSEEMLEFLATVTSLKGIDAEKLTLVPSVVDGAADSEESDGAEAGTPVEASFQADGETVEEVTNEEIIPVNGVWQQIIQVPVSSLEGLQNPTLNLQLLANGSNVMLMSTNVQYNGTSYRKPDMQSSDNHVDSNDDATFEHHKMIDYLGDNGDDSGFYTNRSGEDDYRLYLDMTGKSKPIDVLFVVDESGSMQQEKDLNGPRYQAVENLLNGTGTEDDPGLLQAVLNANPDNRVAVIGFTGDEYKFTGHNQTGSYTDDSDIWIDWTTKSGIGDKEYKNHYVDGSGGKRKTNSLGTDCDAGLYLAAEMFAKEPVNGDGYKHVMIFLSDGAPTYWLNAYQSGGDTYRSGNGLPSDSSNVRTAMDQTLATAELFKEQASGVTIYAVRMGKGNGDYNEWWQTNYTESNFLKSLVAGTGGTSYMADNTTALKNTLWQILFPVGVEIKDTLSEYVDFAAQPDVYVTAQAIDEYGVRTGTPIILYNKGSYTNNNALPNGVKYTGADGSNNSNPIKSVTRSEDTDTILVKFKDDYPMNEKYVYTLSFNVTLTREAKDEYQEKGYNATGDTGTDWGDNLTSSGKDGFYSNKEATVWYKTGTESSEGKTEMYDMPVVQTSMPRKTSGQADQIVGIGSEITYEIEYVNNEDEKATVVIVDHLPDGLTYKKDSATPSEGFTYDEANNILKWEIQNAEPNARDKVSFIVTVNEEAIKTGTLTYDELTNTASVKVGNSSEVSTNTVENPVVKKEEVTPGAGEAVQQGEEITYQVYWENAHDEAATVTVTDKLDPGVNYNAGSASVHYEDGSTPDVWPSEDGHTLTWTIPGVPANTKGYVEFTVTVNETAFTDEGVTSDGIFQPGDKMVRNQANVQIGSDPAVDTNIVDNPVEELKPAITIVKEQQVADGDKTQAYQDVDSGNTVTYYLTITNTGNGEATNVVVQDTIPNGLTFVSGSITPANKGSYDAASGTITWNLGSMAADTSQEVSFQVTVPEVEKDTTWDNMGQVKYSNNPKGPDDLTDSNKVEIRTLVPDVTIVKTQQVNSGEQTKDLQQVEIGDEVTYYLTVTNSGNGVAENVEVKDTVPSDPVNLGLVEGSIKIDGEQAVPDGQYTLSEDGRTITWKLGNIGAAPDNTRTVSFTVKVPKVEKGTKWDNTGYVKCGNDPDRDPEHPKDEDGWEPSNEVKIEVVVPEIGIVKTQKAEPKDGEEDTTPTDQKLDVAENDTVTYYLTVTNNGNAVAKDVVVKDVLPLGKDSSEALTFVPDSVKIGEKEAAAGDAATANTYAYGEATRTLTVNVGDIGVGESKTVSFQVTVSSEPLKDTWTNIGQVSYENNPENPDPTAPEEPKERKWDDSNPVVIEENLVPPVKTETTPGANQGVKPGDKITYTIGWTNYNAEDATVTVTDTLDTGVDFVSASGEGEAAGTYDTDSRTVTWNLGTQAAGATGTVTLTVRVNESALTPGKVENTAKVQVGHRPAVSTETIPNPVTEPHKEEVAPDDGALVKVGDVIEYRITYENYKDEPATVVITDMLDEGLTLDEESLKENGGTYDDATRTITWTLENVPARGSEGSTGSVTFKAAVNENALVDYQVENTAAVKVGDDPAITTETVKNPVTDPHKTEVTPGDKTVVKVGDTIEYSIAYQNYKDTAATVTITDVLDPGLEVDVASVKAGGGTYDESTRTITWKLENVDAHMEGTVTFKATVTKAAYDYGSSDTDSNPDDIFAPGDGKVLNEASVVVDTDPEIRTEIVENPVTDPHKTEKTPGDGELVKVGDEITYEITWRNYQDGPAKVVITDHLDSGVDFVSAVGGSGNTASYDEAAHTVTWTLENQDAGASGIVTLTVRVNENAKTAGEVRNQASVRVGDDPEVYTEEPWNPVPNPEKTEVDPGANEIVKVGDRITYNITWQNFRKETATVIVTDTLDEGVTYVSSNPEGVYDETSRTVTWTFNDRAPKTHDTITLVVEVNEKAKVDDQKVENQASVTVGNDTVQTDIIPNPVPDPKKEEVDPGENERVQVGDEITYTIHWKNYMDEAADVVITDTLDDGVDFVRALDDKETELSKDTVYNENNRTVTWTLEGQDAGAEGEVTLVVKVNENAVTPGIVKNQAGVAVGHDPKVDTNVIPNPVSDPHKTETTPGEGIPVDPNEEITYSISWRNYKETPATITITDKLDPNVDFVSANPGPSTVSDPDEEGRVTVTWTLTDQAAGASGNVTLVVSVKDSAKEAGEVRNKASVQVGDDPAVNTEEVQNPVPNPEKREVTPGENKVVYVGDEISYQITWKNYLSETADVVITDELDPGVDFVSAEGVGDGVEGSYDPNTGIVTWTFKNCAPGAEGVVNLTVKVNANATPAGKVQNQAAVTVGNYPDVTNVIENPTPSPKKEEISEPGEGEYVFVGNTLTYEIEWQNLEGETADVVITDELDPGVDFVSAGNGGVYDETAHTVTWTLKSQEANAAGAVTLTVEVNEKATPAGVVNNKATVQVGNHPAVDTNTIPNPTPNPEKEETDPGKDEVVFVGDEITYHIDWENYKDTAATVVITDKLDPGVDFVSADGVGEGVAGGYDSNTHTVTWTLENRPAKATGTVELKVKVNEKATPAGKVENQAVVKVDNDPEVKTDIIPNPTPNPEKEETDPGANVGVQPGDEITYEIHWKNYRNEEAEVVITDTLDPGVDFKSADNGGKLSEDGSRTVTWNLGRQQPDAEGSVTLTVTVNENAKAETPGETGKVENQAGVKVGDDPKVSTNIIPNPVPDPEKKETTPGEGKAVKAGDTITYTIEWKNYRDEAAEVVITDPLDPGVDFVSATEGYTLGGADGRTVTWNLGTQSAGASGTVTLTVKVNDNAKAAAPGETGWVENQAGVQVGNDPKIDTNIIPNPVPDPQKTETVPEDGAGAMVQPGQEITYEISWENYRDQAADVTITDTLDPNVEFVSAKFNGEEVANAYNAANRRVTWTLAAREPGAKGTVTLTVRVLESAKTAGEVKNQAGVQVDNDAVIDTNIIPNPVPDPQKTETVPEDGAGTMVQPGTEISYEISWKNYQSEAADVTITDALDPNVEFVEAGYAEGAPTGEDPAYDNHTVTWTLKNQPAGAEGTVTLTVRVLDSAKTAGEVKNQAGVTVGNDAEVKTEIIPNPVPNPEKTEVTPGADKMVKVGDTIVYNISWKNYQAEAANVVITDELDAGLDFVSATNDGAYDAGTHTVTWTLENQPAGASGTVQLTVKVNASAKADDSDDVTNQAGVKVGGDPQIDTNIIPNPVPDPHKTETTPGENEMVQPGTEISYEISWKNYQSEAADVTITDTLDPNVEFVSAGYKDGTPAGAEPVHEGSTVTWTLANQPAGAEGTVTLTVRVLDSAKTAGEVKNQAGVKVGDDAEVKTEIIPNPVPNPEKKEETPGANEMVQPGDEITYNISWWNYRTEAADVTVTDTLDPNVEFVSAGPGTEGDGYELKYDNDGRVTGVIWTLENQSPDARGVVTLTVKVLDGAKTAGVVNNQAGVKVGNDAEVKTEIIPNPVPDPHKTETDPGENTRVQVGDEITYEITWKNYQNQPANVTITDTLDAGLSFVSADPEAETTTDDDGNVTVTWNLGTRVAGADGKVTLVVRVNEDAVTKGIVENQAGVKVGNDTEVKTEVIPNPISDPHKTETKPGEDLPVKPGEQITYSISWRNYKSETATVTITDTLDKNVKFVSADPEAVATTGEDGRTTVTWTLADREAGVDGAVTLVVEVLESAKTAGRVENQAHVQVGNDDAVDTEIIPNPVPDPKKTETVPEGGAGTMVQPGDQLTYEIEWQNYKDQPAEVTITDKLDANVAFVSADPEAVTTTDEDGRTTVTWMIDAGANATGKVTLIVEVLESAKTAGEVKNQAGVKVDNDPQIDTNIIPNPVPDPKKTETVPGEDEMVQPGQQITYEIEWQNYKSQAADVTITDTLDENVKFVSADKQGSYDEAGRTVTWTLKSQPANTSGKVMLTVEVLESAKTAGRVENQAGVKVDNDAEVKTEIIPNPVPDPHKTETVPAGGAGTMVQPGDELTYEISWQNYKDQPAVVTITDKLDANVAFVSADPEAVTTTGEDGRTTVTWTIQAEANATGKVTLTVEVLESAKMAGMVNNQAGVKVDNDAEVKTEIIPNPTPNPEKTEVTPGAGKMVQPGDKITYTVNWKNYQTEDADVVITDKLDEGVDFAGASHDGVYDAENHTVTWTFRNQAAGTAGTVTLDVVVNDQAKADESDDIENQAGVKVGNDAEVMTNTIPNPVPDPHKTETVPAGGAGTMVQPGDEITYQITWKNYQAETAAVTITDPLDKNVEFVSADNGGSYNATAHTVTWTFDAAVGTEGTVTLTVKVLDGAKTAGRVENQAGVKVGNDAEVKTEIIPNPTPNPEKTEVTPGENKMVQPGDEITYEITWRNYNDEAANVVIADLLDANVAFVSADNNGSYDAAAHTVTWTFENQAAGANGKVALTVRVLETAKAAGAVNNQAGVKVGNDAEVTTNIVPNPVPNPEKTETSEPGAGGQVFVGDELTYEITWKNYQTETADVIITDPLDAGVDFVSANNDGAYDQATHTVIWTLKAQAAGADGKVTLTVKVNENAKTAGQVNNRAGVKVGNDTEVKTETIPNPTPSPKKTEATPGAGQMVQQGDEITYEISWANYQTETAVVTITDPLDAGVDFVSADNGGTYDAATHTVTWALGQQAVGANGTVTLAVRVNANARPAGRVNNQAGVKVGNDAEVTTNIVPNPVPNPHKTEVNPGARIAVEIGQMITYRVSYVNYQSEAATVTITDRLDPGLDYVNGSADNGGVYDAQTRTITWTIANAAAGSEGFVTFQATVNESASDAGATGAADGIFVPGDFSVLNQASVKVGNDPAVNTEIIENPLVNEGEHYLEGTLTVTKQLLDENGAAMAGDNQTFYAGVFEDAAHTVLSDRVERNLIPLTLNGTNLTSETVAVSFAPGETLTLYVTEVDANGIPVSTETGFQYILSMDKLNVTINEANSAGSVTMTNRPYLPDGFYKSGTLTITKQLLGADGVSKGSDRTFYAGIFADAAYTELAGNVNANIIALPLNGNNSVTETVDVSFGADETVTLYVTEVDENGVPVENAASFEYDVTIDGSTVTLNAETTDASTVITNKELAEEEEEETSFEEERTNTTPGEAESTIPAGTSSVKTGDETPIGLYLGLLLAAALILIVVFVMRRRTRKE